LNSCILQVALLNIHKAINWIRVELRRNTERKTLHAYRYRTQLLNKISDWPFDVKLNMEARGPESAVHSKHPVRYILADATALIE
jgi:hypothetical protein